MTTTFVQLSGGTTSSAWTPWSPDHGAGSFAVGSCSDIVAGDVNGDGKTDLLCPYDYGKEATTTFVQLSSGTTSSAWTPWSPDHGTGSFAVGSCSDIVAGDVNGDGKTDLLCPYDYGKAATTTFVQLSGGMTSNEWTPWSPDHGADTFAVRSCKDIVAGDVNGDGKTDLLCPYDYGKEATTTFVQLSDGPTSSTWTPWSPVHANTMIDFWAMLEPGIGKTRECSQNNNCHSNPACEIRKKLRKLDCERIKVSHIISSEPTEAAIHESRKQMSNRNLDVIPTAVRAELQAYFSSDILDEVRYTSDYSNVLSISQYALDWAGMDAIVFGHIVVFRELSNALNNMGLWAHELEHVKQYKRLGIDGFSQYYTHASSRIEAAAEAQRKYICSQLNSC
ncbi:hypothetical protein IMCC3135_18985 [Granulosicoccus antarcticus IMCC3135]|uniref:eCIS core domain-containing protein n=2 Tax=Granulosicoccus TaxID=437504 RepID=A0A2Z2NQX7_9GAMM|nr:hypothetical protein IMCC3135_18985 [Granulosicoccus antarcticus IMCC3135]